MLQDVNPAEVNDDSLDLVTDQPGFGLQPRDDMGRFAKTDEPEEPAPEPVPEPEPASEPVADPEPEPLAAEAPEAPAEPDAPPHGRKDSPEELARKKIPYSRFKEALDKERAKRQVLEERLRAAEQRIQQPDEIGIDDTQLTKLGDLLIEGKTEEYARGLKAVLQSAVQTGVKIATEKAVAQQTFEQVAMSAEQERAQAAAEWSAKYAVFNPQSEAFDAGITQEAIALRDAYEAQGFTPREAIGRAVQMLARAYELDAPDEAPAPAPAAPAPRPPVAQKKLAVAATQPPTAQGVGELDTAPTLLKRISEMSQEEFDALPEAELEKLRNGFYKRTGS